MTCPRCKLESPASATICDCGYAFSGKREDQSTYYLRTIAEAVNSIRRMILFWIVLTLVGAIVGAFIVAEESGKKEETIRDLQRQVEKGAERLPK
jgi:hypothetical protein